MLSRKEAAGSTATLLSNQTKLEILNLLQKVSKDNLKEALIYAALNLCVFPAPLDAILSDLQKVYKQHQDNPLVKKPLEEAIRNYIKTKGLKIFLATLTQADINTNWPSDLLTTLAKRLNLQFESKPIVEGFIQQGKVFWRIINNGQVVYDRQAHKNGQIINYSQANTWCMTWEQFRLFKDSGKRSGTVAITKERFVGNFKQTYQKQAAHVWEELKRKGVISNKNKLPDEWRAASGVKIKLLSLTNSNYFIQRSNIVECLKELRGVGRKKIVSRENFIAWWDDDFKYQAGLIWDRLKVNGVIDKNHKVTTLTFKFSDFLTNLQLTSEMVCEALYAIVNDPKNKENIPHIPGATIYRPERDVKSWAATGTITNENPNSKIHCNKVWDVGTYGASIHHRNTADEESNGFKLNYDHIPSADFFSRTLEQRENENLKKIDALHEQKNNLKAAIDKHMTQLAAMTTRQQLNDNSADSLKNLKSVLEKVKKLSEEALAEKQLIENEKQEGKLAWWTIAIPEKLHRQGETFMQSAKDQQKSTEKSFLKEMDAYLCMLAKRPEDFSLSKLEDPLKMLGAFRYLFHCQKKSIPALNKTHKIGKTPFIFFQDPKRTTEIDNRFNEGVKNYIEKQEGLRKR